MNPRMFYVAGLVVVLTFVAFRPVGAIQRTGTRVAVCDIQKVFDSIQEWVQIKADLQTMLEDLQEQFKKKQQRLRDLQHDLDLTNRRSAEYPKRIDEIAFAAAEAKSFDFYLSEKVNRNAKLKKEYLFRKVISTVGSIAQENAIDVVLQKEQPPEFPRQLKAQAVDAAIGLRKVLWSSSELELTDQVITKMNNAFTNVP